jgi:hypothetical protein
MKKVRSHSKADWTERLSCPFLRHLAAKILPACSLVDGFGCRHPRWRAGTERRWIVL